MSPRNRIRATFDSAAFKMACDFLKRHFRIVAELNDQPADLQFGFIRHETTIFFREAVWRVCEAAIFRIGEAALVRAEPNALALQLIEHRLFRDAEFLADLGGGKALFEVMLTVIGGVFPMALLGKLYRIQICRGRRNVVRTTFSGLHHFCLYEHPSDNDRAG
jgi:hypothetical protein